VQIDFELHGTIPTGQAPRILRDVLAQLADNANSKPAGD
jgi:hypothetical protein